ncbi:2-oxoglutarate and iron-dependent oxygenase domain-containing protein [Variovorax dokdonensis]|uniref:2-oxoglutarate-dependent ethylene/succinate-forming enzyme n=1 Tax=Variovorax dokdonensis TaxID=344883 RepID=A0ABT7NED2_9BURK|nr:2-oxoglutarate and iron-dependent oxygenase domain-containing protein [Variovorax dokdonensis]MDM0046175.1 2-oxoglutarate and iron-dependent oxygenase domain-containing protein [Variovorax dokdonensis]
MTAQNIPESLPVIDVSALFGDDLDARQAIATQLRDACENRGFFYIRGHGIEPALIDEVFGQSVRFFSQQTDDKMLLDKAKSNCHRGYEPMRNQTLQAGSPPDLKEGYYIGVDLPADDPRVIAGKFNHGPNQWPADLPGFQETMNRYIAQATRLGTTLMRALALSLDLPERHFDSFLEGAMLTLRPLHYPPQPPNPQPGEKGCGEHTDFGSLTILLQDHVGGLQVWDAESNGWIDAPPVPGTFVVNIGDLIQRWTNGRYHSTMHRVVNISGRERYSVPFFLTGAPDYEVSCLPTCLGEGEAPRWPSITVAEHLSECYRRTYGDGKA